MKKYIILLIGLSIILCGCIDEWGLFLGGGSGCGYINDPCCTSGDPCRMPHLACDKGYCDFCGSKPAQMCCEGSKCSSSNLICESNGRCAECGKISSPCCTGDKCLDDELKCVGVADGVCDPDCVGLDDPDCSESDNPKFQRPTTTSTTLGRKPGKLSSTTITGKPSLRPTSTVIDSSSDIYQVIPFALFIFVIFAVAVVFFKK